jgi:hypothetical protein
MQQHPNLLPDRPIADRHSLARSLVATVRVGCRGDRHANPLTNRHRAGLPSIDVRSALDQC